MKATIINRLLVEAPWPPAQGKNHDSHKWDWWQWYIDGWCRCRWHSTSMFLLLFFMNSVSWTHFYSISITRMPRTTPLLTFSGIELRSVTSPTSHGDSDTPQKHWQQYLPLCGMFVIRSWCSKIRPSTEPSIGTVVLLLIPHPSWLYVLVNFHLQTMRQPFIFAIHLMVSYTLTFMIFSSLIVCVARDPGPVHPPISQLEGGDEEEMGLTEALMPDRDFEAPEKWCRKCWVRGKI